MSEFCERVPNAEMRSCDAIEVERTFTPAVDFPRPFQERAPRRRVGSWIAAAGALVAGFVLAFAWPRSASSRVVDDQVRSKGVVGFYVARDDHVRRGAVREWVMPHDRIQLFTTTTSPMWFAVIGDDAAGMRVVYVAPRLLDPGREQLLPLSIEVDATLGDEQITAVFCPDSFAVTAPPATCTLDRFTLAKTQLRR